ncbi:rho guanine nucleotide exchange factor 28 isoform X2 [Colossoma macropomum]|uniref:rho guanine nucleotide exchange factor 28 isoform X2 n=1 Tax=Colossoma macropomum TaxID=42526 RepID=UPI001864C343|nr:rho guanine nucleotide exchange factor 28 isoform X2 [Colossoma macropomum]
MELIREEVPLYGQVEACVILQVSQSAQENAEYYVLLEGSSFHHVTTAQKKEKGRLLSFTVPGHNVPEKVSLQVYRWEDSSNQVTPLSESQELSLDYKRDNVQEVADLLISNPDHLTSINYQDIQRKFCLGENFRFGQNSSDMTIQPGSSSQEQLEETLGFDKSLDEPKEGLPGEEKDHSPSDSSACWELGPEHGCTPKPCSTVDVKITQALANCQSYLEWTGQKTQESQGHHRETLLQIAVNLGLCHVTLFYLQKSEDQKMTVLPNGEGHGPVELTQSRDDVATSSSTKPSACRESRPLWMSEVWTDDSHLLRFCPLTSSLVLTVKHSAHVDAQHSIQLYREKMKDLKMHTQVTELSESTEKNRKSLTDDTSDGDLTNQMSTEDSALVDSVFEEQLVLSLDEDEETPASCNSEKPCSSPGSCSPFQPHSTHTAAARLAAMLSRSGKVPQLPLCDDDLNKKYNVAGVTGDSSGTDSGVWLGSGTETSSPGTMDTPLPVKEEEGPKEKPPFSRPFSPSFAHFSPTSPAGLVLDRFLRGTRPTELTYNSAVSPPESYELSPSLVALEMDSEEEDDDFLMKKPLPQISSDHKTNGEERDSFNPAPDLTCIRSHSASSACNPASSKESVDQGGRLRSYSYSSPKISLLPPRFSRDAQPPSADLSQDGALSGSSGSRSLLQALSLSKSLSLLNPVKQRAFSLTEQPQEKRIEEEEWDRYIIPSKTESEKYKVSRTFSFIKSRMYSTRKNKGKAKEREAKEKQGNGHQFTAGPGQGSSVCEVCDKPAAGKETLHCTNCAVSIHKGCKDSAAQCLKKVHDKYAVSMVKTRAATLPQNYTVRETASSSPMATSASLPVMTLRDRKDTTPLPCPLSRSVPLVPERLAESPEGDNDSSSWRTPLQSEELLQTVESSTSTESSLVEDTVDAPLQNELEADAQDLEAESWSLAMEPQFCQKQEKHTIKRQDVIYELMQTELHHLQTLTVMAEVFRRGMRDEVGLDADTIGRIFPCLDELLLLHRDFLSAMRERRYGSAQPDSDRNYLIHRVGDILLQQFSQENAETVKQVYGEFCSHHTDAVSFFKELQQQNKRFQLFIKQQSSNSLVKRREIPECILLVTQRITKYPVLIERILQYTEEGTEEHADLSAALAHIRDLISAVDLRVSQHEQSQWLSEVLSRMENKSSAKLKDGHTFRKQDMASGRALLHHGPLLWKTATGRLKDVLALLLTDLLVFLQEKDQKYIFATVDQKPPVISLQKLIVREVANEERGMFLISASSVGPEMYEVHTASKDERNAWMRLIREAVVICHEKEDDTACESEEERKVAEAKVQRIHKLQESLCGQDQLICSSLEEKLQIYAELSAMAGHRDVGPEPRLLVRPGTDELPHAAVLLNAALKEAESLRAALSSRCGSPSSSAVLPTLLEQTAPDTSGKESLPAALSPPPSPAEGESPLVDTPRGEEEEVGGEEGLDLQLQNHSTATDNHNMHIQVCQSVQSLTQLLYSLQAAVTIQDSCYEVQRLLLLLLSNHAPHNTQPRPSVGLQEQERQREAERRREEAAGVARLRSTLARERQQWERECHAQQLRHSQQEGVLEQREQQCHLETQRLQQEREELQEQLQDYQQSLERLREGQRSVERERERLETQRRLLDSWRHGRQRSLPAMVIPLDGQQGIHHGSQDEDTSIFVNEAAFLTPSMNNRHLHDHQHQYHHNPDLRPGLLGYTDSPSAQNSLNSLLAWSNHSHPTIGMPNPSTTQEEWVGSQGTENTNNDTGPPSHAGVAWTAGVAGVGLYQGDALSVPPAYVSMETENRDAEAEENIVYL